MRVLNIDQLIRVEVEDHGDGIAVKFQPRIFGKFAQADHGNTRHQGSPG